MSILGMSHNTLVLSVGQVHYSSAARCAREFLAIVLTNDAQCSSSFMRHNIAIHMWNNPHLQVQDTEDTAFWVCRTADAGIWYTLYLSR